MLRLCLLLCLAAASASCCAPNSPQRPATSGQSPPPSPLPSSTPQPAEQPQLVQPHPPGTEDCPPLYMIMQTELDNAYPNKAKPRAPPMIRDAYFACRGAAPAFFYMTSDGQIQPAQAVGCNPQRQWFVVGVAQQPVLPVTKVVCSTR